MTSQVALTILQLCHIADTDYIYLSKLRDSGLMLALQETTSDLDSRKDANVTSSTLVSVLPLGK